MNKKLLIGTRDSQLAIWQATRVQNLLLNLDVKSELVLIKTEGISDLTKPLYEMGVQGIFTKSLDIALLRGEIDVAVHCMKDVPTSLPQGICQGAVLTRGPSQDVILSKRPIKEFKNASSIATGSLRRKAQWLSRFPRHKIFQIRGNINTRIDKLEQSNWDAVIFAKAALERLSISAHYITLLDWMIPAPAQGAIMIAVKSEDKAIKKLLAPLNDKKSEICTKIERDFLSALEGGCTAPIGALAAFEGTQISFTGGVFSLNGDDKKIITKKFNQSQCPSIGIRIAEDLLVMGGDKLMSDFKKNKNVL